MADEDQESKTEQASPRRREKAREDGQVARSQDLGAALSVLGGLIAFAAFGSMLTVSMTEAFELAWADMAVWEAGGGSLQSLLVMSMAKVSLALIGLLLVLMVIGVAGTVVQVGWHPNPGLLAGKWDRVDPLQGFSRLFSLQSVGSLITGCLKLLAIGLTAYLFVRPMFPDFPQFSQLQIGELLPHTAALTTSLGWRVAIAMLVIGAADYLFQWWRLERSLRMTKQEVKEENKEQDGDPHIKQKVRQIQRQMAMRRMMEDVPKATVVITNPTHVAVALRYDPQAPGAPVVVAKGERLVAQRIKERARAAGVPVIEEPPLARALLRAAKVGQEIPAAFYRAVAQILALIMRNARPARSAGPQLQDDPGLDGSLAQ